MRLIAPALVLALVGTQTAFAMPLGDPAERVPTLAEPYVADPSGVDFSGIVALSNCSGSLVRFTTSAADDKAMVLSNGHCYEGGFLTPGEVLIDQASTRTFTLLSPDGTSSLARLRATRLIYATMTTTDVSLYRLSQTYAEIEAQTGITALTISDHHATAADPIRVVSGFWRRIYSCNIDKFVPTLKEGTWTFADSMRYTQPGCEVIGGTSGSPVVHATTHEIVGVNNTINESGQQCTVNNPCEVDSAGHVTAQKGAAYGQELHLFYGCIDSANALDLTQPGCALPKP